MSISEEYIVIYLLLSSIVLLYLMRFIEPEIERIEIENKMRINSYLPFCISSPLLTAINQKNKNTYETCIDSEKV